MPPAKFSDVYAAIGEPKKELEKIENYKDVIFWSFYRKDYQKTNWWSKTANAGISIKLTIRTANTIRKIVGMQLYREQVVKEGLWLQAKNIYNLFQDSCRNQKKLHKNEKKK